MITRQKTNIPQWLISLPVVIWAATLLFGTTLLLILLNTDKGSLFAVQFHIYVAVAVVFNVAVLLFMVAAAMHHSQNNRVLVSGIVLMLTNLPIAFFYLFLLMHFARFLK